MSAIRCPAAGPCAFAHSSSPSPVNFATNPSVSPPAASAVTPVPESKSISPVKNPLTYTSPAAFTATVVACSCVAPPKVFAQSRSPFVSSFRKNKSVAPFAPKVLVPAPGSKSTCPENEPTRYRFPAASCASPRASSVPKPPILLAHSRLPRASSFVMKISRPPTAVRFVTPAPGSKSTVPLKVPALVTFPSRSIATTAPSSRPLAPNVRAQANPMSVSNRSSAARFPFPAASVKRFGSTHTRPTPFTPAAGVYTAV